MLSPRFYFRTVEEERGNPLHDDNNGNNRVRMAAQLADGMRWVGNNRESSQKQ